MIISDEIVPIRSIHAQIGESELNTLKYQLIDKAPRLAHLWYYITKTDAVFPLTIDWVVDEMASDHCLENNAFIVYHCMYNREAKLQRPGVGLLIIAHPDHLVVEAFNITKEAEKAMHPIHRVAVRNCTSLANLIELVEAMIL
jgi:hypothetical protein